MTKPTRECALVAPFLTAREGELSPEERRLVDAHVPGCELCGRIAADFAAMDGLLGEALLAQAARRDFAPFVDAVMERVERHAVHPVRAERRPAAEAIGVEPPAEGTGFIDLLVAWVRSHRRAAAATALAPTLAAVAVLLYLSSAAGPPPPHAGEVEVVAEGSVPMVIQTSDGPVVLLGDPEGT